MDFTRGRQVTGKRGRNAAHLFVATLQQEGRGTAIALDARDVETRFRVVQFGLAVPQEWRFGSISSAGAGVASATGLEQAAFSLNRDSRIGLISDSSSMLG